MGKAPTQATRIPTGRASRMLRLGSVVAGVAGNVALRAAQDVARGTRPEMRQLLLSPANLTRLADQLARMRGAAMKIGQLMSMDAGDVLPPDLAQILARLRDDAHVMPPKQLKSVLNAQWGADWMRGFKRFETRPIAAASIGQVHRAVTKTGQEVAIKVQYPGVAGSIDSDVKNVGALVRMSGLLPDGFDLAPYLEEARTQLHAETDYLREAAALGRFGAYLQDDPDFVVPQLVPDWTTAQILTMSYVPGQPIEDAAQLPQEARDRIVTRLFALFLQELFDFHEMQSDPNFANYRYDPQTGRIVLLDFGAARSIPQDLTGQIRQVLQAGLTADTAALRRAIADLGLLPETARPDHLARVAGMAATAAAALLDPPVFDFATSPLSRQMQTQGLELAKDGYVPPPLPMDLLYLQRKAGGLFLLASRLGAVAPLRAMIDARVHARVGSEPA